MQSSKKQSTVQTSHKIDIQQSISQIINLFDTLFTLRLIDKISRPVANSQRLQIVQSYKVRFNDLHYKLQNLRKIATQSPYPSTIKSSDKNQQKSTKVHRPIDLKNQIRKIQSKYGELFRDGSFKHYDRVAKIYGLPQNMYLININNWAMQILNANGNKKTCC